MNKAQIRTQVKAILNRNDCDNATADNFIELALSRIQRTLRVAPMERQQNFTSNDVGDNLLVLPNDFLSMKYIWAEDVMLEYKDFTTYLKYPESTGSPKIYTRVRGGLLVKPTPPLDTEISIIYYGEFNDLPTDTSENALTNFAPDLLIYGALTFASDFYVDDRRELFENRYSTIYNEIEEQSRTVEWDQSTLAVQAVYPQIEY
jgi:hypothetical protein